MAQAVEISLGGGQATVTVEGRQRFPVQLRYARDYRQDVEAIGDVLVTGSATPATLSTPGPVGGPVGGTVPGMSATRSPGSNGMEAKGSGMGSNQETLGRREVPVATPKQTAACQRQPATGRCRPVRGRRG